MDPYIPENLMRDLIGHDRQPSAFLLYFYLWWRTAGQGSKALVASLQDLSNQTGLSKRTLQNARAILLKRKLISIHKGNTPTAAPEYKVLTPWIRGVKRMTAK